MLTKCLAALAWSVIATVFVACESEQETDDDAEVLRMQDEALLAAMTGQYFYLVDFEIEGVKHPAVEGFGTWSRAGIGITDRGMLKGSTGLNALDSELSFGKGGAVVIVDQHLVMQSLAQTSLGCSGCEALLAQEAAMVQVLTNQPKVEHHERTLVLATNDCRMSFAQAVTP